LQSTNNKDKNSLEQIPANEEKIADALGERLKAKIIRDNAGKAMRRDAHPKMHGLVKASFTIEPNLSDELSIGLFSKPKSYSAWIRFSNQDGTINPDIQRDIRGMAIKLMGVPGEKLFPGENEGADKKDVQEETTHDFITISTPIFVTKDAEEFDDLIKALVNGTKQKIKFFSTHWRVILNLSKAMKKFANPLQIRYFSCTPYLLGDQAIKYSVIPHIKAFDNIPSNADDNFLRESMIRQLDQEEVLFDFCVQFQKDATQMPVEDPGKLWDESVSPFHKVATIRIFRQSFSTPKQDELGENLSFNPWRVFPEHRPLGGVNRTRKVVYDLISSFRHKENNQEQREPTKFEC